MREVFATEPEVAVEYIVLADPDSLAEVEQLTGPTVALVAARVGSTRLIDNEILLASTRA
jgi:pantoate--beta-alanine ligase